MATIENMPSYIHTFTGKWVDPLNLRVEDVDPTDIMHALSNQCRWSGHTREFYSVGQHSVLCSFVVPPEFAWDALWHDGAEGYLQDMAKPLKNHPRLGQAYRGAEQRIEKVIGEALGVTFPFPGPVKDADLVLLVTEARDLVHGTDRWVHYKEIEPMEATIVPWSPKKTFKNFVRRYEQLAALQ